MESIHRRACINALLEILKLITENKRLLQRPVSVIQDNNQTDIDNIRSDNLTNIWQICVYIKSTFSAVFTCISLWQRYICKSKTFSIFRWKSSILIFMALAPVIIAKFICGILNHMYILRKKSNSAKAEVECKSVNHDGCFLQKVGIVFYCSSSFLSSTSLQTKGNWIKSDSWSIGLLLSLISTFQDLCKALGVFSIMTTDRNIGQNYKSNLPSCHNPESSFKTNIQTFL